MAYSATIVAAQLICRLCTHAKKDCNILYNKLVSRMKKKNKCHKTYTKGDINNKIYDNMTKDNKPNQSARKKTNQPAYHTQQPQR